VSSKPYHQILLTSAIFTYDIYAVYINQRPTERRIVWASQISIGITAILMGVLGLVFFYVGIVRVVQASLTSVNGIPVYAHGNNYRLRRGTRRILRHLA
jgi:Na+/proline symporter